MIMVVNWFFFLMKASRRDWSRGMGLSYAMKIGFHNSGSVIWHIDQSHKNATLQFIALQICSHRFEAVSLSPTWNMRSHQLVVLTPLRRSRSVGDIFINLWYSHFSIQSTIWAYSHPPEGCSSPLKMLHHLISHRHVLA